MNSKTRSTLFLVLLTITLIICSTLVLTISINNAEENVAYADTTEVSTAEEFTTAVGIGGSIKLTSNFDLPQNDRLYFMKNLTIDLNGHTLTVIETDLYSYWGILADVVIKDTSANGDGKIIHPSIEYTILIEDQGSLTLEGGTLSFTNTVMVYGIDVWQGPFTMTGGTIESQGYTIYRDGEKVTISGGTIKGDFKDSTGDIDITGGSFSFDPISLLKPGYTAPKIGDYWVVNGVIPVDPASDGDETPGGEETPTPKNKVEDKDNGVSVETSDGTELPDDITLKVVVKTEVATKEGTIDQAKIQEKIGAKEKIAKVYDIKLIKIVGENEEEIQPSDIQDGMKVKVQITLPKGVKANGLRILHIHSNGTIDEINNVNVVDGVAIIEVSSFSEFVLVTPASHGFCVGWIVFIFVILELLATCLYVIIRYRFFKELVAKCKLDCLYDKLDLMTFIGLCVAGGIFLFAFIALCCHQCALTIIMFILAFIICGGFTFLFLEDKGITHLLPKKVEDKPQE